MVIWTQPARADLKHIHDFIAEDSKYYAKKVAQEIREKTDILNKLPEMGKGVAEVKNDICYVLAVIHKRRDFSADDLP